jgi:hypothetical protein
MPPAAAYRARKPPSMTSSVPVTNEASSEARSIGDDVFKRARRD